MDEYESLSHSKWECKYHELRNYGDSALNAVHYPTKVFTDRFRAMSIECTVTVIAANLRFGAHNGLTCHVRKVPKNEPALAGGRWPGGRAYCIQRSNYLIERR
jgi:hypothetical protein